MPSIAQRILDTSTAVERDTIAAQITGRLQSILDSTEPATNAFHEALLALAEIGTRYGTLDPVQLVEPLELVVASATDPEVQGRGQAWLLAVSPADPAKASEGEKLLMEIRQEKHLLAIAERGLAAIVQQQTGAAADRAKQLRLQVTEAALSLSPAERELTFWLYQKSEALADVQQYEQALSVLTELQQRFPRDAGVQLRMARLMTREYAEREPAKPLAKWRQLATQLQTPHAQLVRSQIPGCLAAGEVRSEKRKRRKLLEYLKAVPPGWENSTLKG